MKEGKRGLNFVMWWKILTNFFFCLQDQRHTKNTTMYMNMPILTCCKIFWKVGSSSSIFLLLHTKSIMLSTMPSTIPSTMPSSMISSMASSMPSSSWLGVAPISVVALACYVATQVFMIQHKKLDESINPLLSPLLISSTNPYKRRKKSRKQASEKLVHKENENN